MMIQDAELAVTRAVRDTIVTVQTRDALGLAVDIAAMSVAITLAALAIMMLFVLRDIRFQLAGTRSALQLALAPLNVRGRAIADNVEFITDALRSDVSRLTASVQSLTDRLQQASDHMEERIEDFNALMEVVQGEAEEIFLDAAATAHGVKVGARAALSGSRPSSSQPVEEGGEGERSADSALVTSGYTSPDTLATNVDPVPVSPPTPVPDRVQPLQPPGEQGEGRR